MSTTVRRLVGVAACCLFLVVSLYGEPASPDPQSSTVSHARATNSLEDQGKVGFAVKASLLGVGAELAARVSHRSNVRAGYNVLGYSRTFDKDGISYSGHLSFRTFEAHYDFFPWAGSFHVSGGLVDYIGNPISANALIPQDSSFTLGGHTYYGAPAPNQPSAHGRVNFNQVSPSVTVGWGNLVHRDSKHFAVPFEIGVIFQGSPKSTLELAGNVCDQPSTSGILANCRPVASDPTVQSNILSEQTKLNKSMKPFKYYPIISIGFGYTF